MRDDLLRSTEISRSASYIDVKSEFEDPADVVLPPESPVLLPEQVSGAFMGDNLLAQHANGFQSASACGPIRYSETTIHGDESSQNPEKCLASG